MVYTLKRYLKELKINPYWEVEPHFFYWLLHTSFEDLRTISKNNMSSGDYQSAMYGEFIIKGKPMLDGFVKNLNFTIRITKMINDN